jgi:hypothetical protein
MIMRVFLRSFIFVAILAAPLAAQWDKTPTSVAWTANGRDVWRFSFDPKFGKPFFHPLTVAAGQSFTNFKPEDHPWHYAHWFSWKYINHVNYWEEDRQSGQAAGRTRWDTPEIATRNDGSATIKMHLTYTRPTGEVDMTEDRTITVSAPGSDGSYAIDWSMRFTAGAEGAVLDRTPMPGEPNGVVNGGYAGLSMRLAAAPMMMSIMTSNGAVGAYDHDRARPGAPAVAGNFTQDGKDMGGIAVLSDPANAGQEAPWYIINVPTDFRFIDAAILAPAIRTIPANGTFSLRYRVSLKGSAWSQQELVKALNSWK